jgi:cysteine desulfurase
VPYFDFNATAPLHPEARRAWLEVNDRAWHNPSGLYAEATVARDILEDARERLSDLLCCPPERIVFTVGATAASNALARHVAKSVALDQTVAISAIEHPCVRDAFVDVLPERVVEIPVDRHGVVRLEDVARMLRRGETAFVSVMAASNETGAIQPWQEIAAVCRQHGASFHTDAAQWLGKMPAAGVGDCDWVTGSGHKFGSPKGVGFLVVPAGAAGFRGDRGGTQERGRWAGTDKTECGING